LKEEGNYHKNDHITVQLKAGGKGWVLRSKSKPNYLFILTR